MRDPARMSVLPDVVCQAVDATPQPAQGVHVLLQCAGLLCPLRLPAPQEPAPRHMPLSAPQQAAGYISALGHSPVAVEHASTAWHAGSLAPGKPMACARRAPFLP